MFHELFGTGASALMVLLVISAIIFVHELGHFLACKKVGVKVEVFSLGMGPYLFSFRFGETLYAFSLLPLGGYVKMAGENALGKADTEPKPFEYGAKTPLQKAQIAVAGVLMNALFGYLAFVAGLTVGERTVPPEVNRMVPGGAAERAGIPQGSRIIEVDGGRVYSFHDLLIRLSGTGRSRVRVRLRTPSGEEKEAWLDVGQGEGMPDLGFSPAKPVRIGVNFRERVLVGKVNPGSAAEEAGLLPGDEIVAVNGERIEGVEDLKARIRDAGEREITLLVARNGFPKTLTATPRKSPGAPYPMLGVLLQPEKTVAEVLPGSPAAEAGLRPGDRILDVRLSETLRKDTGKSVLTARIKARSDGGKEKELTLETGFDGPGGDPVAFVAPMEFVRVPLPESFIAGWLRTKYVATAVLRLLKRYLSFEASPKEVGGPVMVFKVTFDAVRTGPGVLLFLIGFISINLAIFNLLPFPPLDGGLLVLHAYEGVRKKPLPLRAQEIFQTAGIVLLLFLAVLLTANDLFRLFGQG